MLCSIFQGHVARILAVQIFYPETYSIGEVDESQLTAKCFPLNDRVMKYSENHSNVHVKERFQCQFDVRSVMKNIAYKRNAVFYDPGIFLNIFIISLQLFND